MHTTIIQQLVGCSFSYTLIPNELHQVIANKKGRPDLTSISILSEIIYWYRPRLVTDKATGTKKQANKFLGDVWQTSYSHFERKFNFSHETIRRSLAKLELLGFIKREFRTVSLRGQQYNNALFIHLNFDKCILFTKNPTHTASVKSVNDGALLNNSVDNTYFFEPIREAPSPQVVGDNNIDIKNKKNNNRSIESNFFKSKFKNSKNTDHRAKLTESWNTTYLKSHVDKDKQNTAITTEYLQTSIKNGSSVYTHPRGWVCKSLKDFYPLNEEDAIAVIQESNRDFSVNFINKLLLRLSEKYPHHRFFRKKSFISYMVKALCNEMRQTTMANNENFEFKRDSASYNRDKYLEEVEYSKDMSKEAQLRRKIAAIFDPEIAYKLLLNGRFRINKEDNKTVLITELPDILELTQLQHAILLEQSRAVYGNVDTLQLCINTSHAEAMDKISKEQKIVVQADQQSDQKLVGQRTVWNDMRLKLQNYYGVGIDKSWFSKLIAEEDAEQKILKLKAPTEFIRDWVQQYYYNDIEQLCSEYEYNLQW